MEVTEAVPMRFWQFGRSFLERASNRLGIPVAHAETIPMIQQPRLTAEDSAFLKNTRFVYQPNSRFVVGAIHESPLPVSRALFDYRDRFSDKVEDYELPLLLAAADPNLKFTLWIRGSGAQVSGLETDLRRYAEDRFGFYPAHFKIEAAPVNVISTVFARARKLKVPAGFVSSDETLFHEVSVGKDVIFAIGSSQNTSVQGLIDGLLAQKLLKPSFDYTRVYSGPDLAEGRWSHLLADLESWKAEARLATAA